MHGAQMIAAHLSSPSSNSLIGDWQDWLPLHYAAMSHRNGARRRRREAATARRAQVGAATPTDDQRAFRDLASIARDHGVPQWQTGLRKASAGSAVPSAATHSMRARQLYGGHGRTTIAASWRRGRRLRP
jgi:hypothetical protein